MPKAIRRITGALLILLGAAGLALMLLGAAGCLLARQYSILVASRTCERVERLLAVSAGSTGQIKACLEKACANLTTVRAKFSNLDLSDKTLMVRREKIGRLVNELSPQLEKARQLAASVADSAVVLTTLIEGLNAVLLAPRVGLDIDQVNDLSDRLIDLMAEAQKFGGMLGEAPGQQISLNEVEKRAARLDERLAEATTRVGQLANRVAEAQLRVAEVQSSLHRWITAGVLVLIVVLLWLGLGQLCLLVQGWSWCKGYRP